MADKVEIPIEVIDLFSSRLDKLEKKLGESTKATEKLHGAANLMVADIIAKYGERALRVVVDFAKESVKAAGEQETANIKLATAMKNLGTYTDAGLQKQIAFASSLQFVVGVEDEVIVETQALLTTFGLTGQALDRATKATIDFSKSQGVDLHAAALLLGKAYTGNTQALGRYGIAIDESARGAEKFEAVMSQLERRFGGSAAAQMSGYSGEVKNLDLAFGELKETVGGLITPEVQSSIRGLATLAGWGTSALKMYQDLRAELDKFATSAAMKVLGPVGGLIFGAAGVDLSRGAKKGAGVSGAGRGAGIAGGEQAGPKVGTEDFEAFMGASTEAFAQFHGQAVEADRLLLELELSASNDRVALFQLEQAQKREAFERTAATNAQRVAFEAAQEKALAKYKGQLAKEEVKLKIEEAQAKIALVQGTGEATLAIAGAIFGQSKELAVAEIMLARGIAIANIIAQGSKLPPFVAAIYIAAQVAAAITAIDQATSDIGAVNFSADRINAPQFGEMQTGDFSASGGGGGGGSRTMSSSAGAGKIVNIYVGGVTVSASFEKLDTSNVRQVARDLGEIMKQKEVEAIQLAILSKETADAFADYAV